MTQDRTKVAAIDCDIHSELPPFPLPQARCVLDQRWRGCAWLGSTEPLKVMDSVSGHKYHWPGEDSVFLDAPTLMWEIPDFDVRFDHTLWLALPRSEKLGRERAPIGTIADPVERGDYHANCR